MKRCIGTFSPEVQALLKEAFAEFGYSARETFDTYKCNTCNTSGHIAKNHAGTWEPESHYPPARKKVNPSGKSGYYKK